MTSNPNILPSERATVKDVLNPASVAASTVTTGWVDMSKLESLMALLQTGVLGASATVDAKLRQAKDSGGTAAKDITGKAITQLVKASHDNKQVAINLRAEEMDCAGGFTHAQLSVTVGTAASLLSAVLLGFDAHYAPTQAASFVQAVA